MVQRKVPDELPFQAHHAIKSEKRLGNLKPTSCQRQDAKSRGSDIKKKMKRSRSIKLSNTKSFYSSPLRETISQPQKLATPQKQAMIKTSGARPNYMKATSSSEARKERCQVSSLNTQAGFDSKNLRRRNTNNSRVSSDSGNKEKKSLTKSSSLKLVRTLTKTPSFKPVRNGAKKCSRAALCADFNVQKATCSSTLKDSKFPPYLMLNPGGTESEGTSVLKVCRYTYCSLNGHHHTPLPPLRCFLKAKRRSLKFQKSSKPEVSFLCRVKPSGNETEEVGMDFFVEIYAKNITDGAETTEKHAENNEGNFGFRGEPKEDHSKFYFHGDDKAAGDQDNKDQVSENLSDASPLSEIDLEENKYANSGEVWKAGDLLEEQKTEASMDEDGDVSDTSDMEWEEGQLFNTEINTEVDYLNKRAKEYCISLEYPSEFKQLVLPDEPKIITSEDIISYCTDEILVDDVLQELFDEETTSCSTQCYDSDSEMEGKSEILEATQLDADIAHDQLSFIENAFEEPAQVDEKVEESGRDLDNAPSAVITMEESIMEPAVANENILKDGECEGENEAWNHSQEDKSLQFDNGIDFLQGQIADSSESFDNTNNVETNECHKLKETEADQNLAGLRDPPSGAAEDPTEEQEQVANHSSQSSCEATQDDAEFDDIQNHIITQAQLGKIPEDINSIQELVNELELAQNCVHQLDDQDESINVVENLNLLEKDREGANNSKIQTSKDSGEQIDSVIYKLSSSGNETGVENMEVEVNTRSDVEQNSLTENNGTISGSGSRCPCKGCNSSQELADTCGNRKWTIKCKKPIMDSEDERQFNPREPNFLPVVPDPEAEKVDLKHHIMDDRKNSEEWMIDYALQQAVTKLAPARKRKVALLVEAFETVLPVPNYNTRISDTKSAFSLSRSIQACS